MRSLIYRVGLSVGLAIMMGAAPVAAQPVPEGPMLVVANPQAGDMLTPGKLMIEGVAFDPIATEGVGVDRVSVFLDDRDAGGTFLGDATLGAPNFVTAQPTQFANAGWTLTTPVLKGTGDGHELFIYARSAVTGDEAIQHFPVFIGEKAGTTAGFEAPAAPPTEPIIPDDSGVPPE